MATDFRCPPSERQISEAAALCGITVDEFLDALWRKRREYDRGIDAREYWKEFAEYIGRDFDDALLNEMRCGARSISGPSSIRAC